MTLPATQKAVAITGIGKPVELITDWPVSKPGPKQVLLKVHVAGINPHDHKVRDSGLFVNNKLPAVPTNDVVGTVVALGPGVTEYQIGDRVLSHAGFGGANPWEQNGLQEYAIHDVGAGFKIPESVTDDEAATLPTNIIAPLVGLFNNERGVGIPAPWTEEGKKFDYKGTSLLILGGGSNCGKFATQLAGLAGIGTVVVVGGPEKELKSWGATHVIDRHGSIGEVLRKVRDIVGDDLVYAFDAINPPPTQILGISALSSTKKGKMARLLPTGPLDETKVVGKKAGFELIDVFGASQLFPQLCYPFWERAPEYLASGKLHPLEYVLKEGLTPENVNEVMDRYRDGKKVVKTHIHF